MLSRARLAAAMTLLLAAACQPDMTSTPAHRVQPGAEPITRTTVATDAPGTFTIFPSVFVSGGFGANAVGYVSVPSVSDVDRTFQLTTDNPLVTPNVPATVTVPAGADRANVSITPIAVSTPTTVTLSLSGGGSTLTSSLTAYPAGATLPPSLLDTIFATPLTVTGGQPSTATIRLKAPAAAGGLVVTLFTRLPLSATMPPTVTFPAGATVETVPITTFPGFPNSTTTVLIQAAAQDTLVGNGVNVVTGAVQEPLGVNAPTFAAPLVGGVPAVVGGSLVPATISLTGPAPTGGALITLVSTDQTVATVPASVTIPAGATSASFTVTTNVVSSSTSSNIGGSFAGGVVVSTLAVTPAASSPPPTTNPPAAPSLISPAADAQFAPHQSITFDWSDVAGATSYTIQISTTDKFTSTVVNTDVASSQYTTAALPTSRLWWRVRSNSANGASSFTSARRFEVK